MADFDKALVFILQHATPEEAHVINAWLNERVTPDILNRIADWTAQSTRPNLHELDLNLPQTSPMDVAKFVYARLQNDDPDAAESCPSMGPSLEGLLNWLDAKQNVDGGWAVNSGPSDVLTSILVLVVLLRLEHFDSHPFFN